MGMLCHSMCTSLEWQNLHAHAAPTSTAPDLAFASRLRWECKFNGHTHDTGENGAVVLLQCSQSSAVADGL